MKNEDTDADGDLIFCMRFTLDVSLNIPQGLMFTAHGFVACRTPKMDVTWPVSYDTFIFQRPIAVEVYLKSCSSSIFRNFMVLKNPHRSIRPSSFFALNNKAPDIFMYSDCWLVVIDQSGASLQTEGKRTFYNPENSVLQFLLDNIML